MRGKRKRQELARGVKSRHVLLPPQVTYSLPTGEAEFAELLVIQRGDFTPEVAKADSPPAIF